MTKRKIKELPNVMQIGGGTGTATVLTGLREREVNLTAGIVMTDDGGSNARMIKEFHMLPSSGIRQAIAALAEESGILRDLFDYRFHQGDGIRGMTMGNLLFAAMADITGSEAKAYAEAAKLLAVKGNVIPMSWDDNVKLVATYEDGSVVTGEHYIDEAEHHDGTLRITKLETNKPATISPEAYQAIIESNLIIFGPGDLYTNTIAALAVEGVVQALEETDATIMFFVNLMTKYGESFNYTASDYIEDLAQYMPLDLLNMIAINSDNNYPPEVLAAYEKEYAHPVKDNLDQAALPTHILTIRRPLLSQEEIKPVAGDVLKRSRIRHDAHAIGDLVMDILATKK